MIDFHAHVLAGLDDGAKDLNESLKMCERSYEDGVRTIVATPHTLNGVYRNDRTTILQKVQELSRLLNEGPDRISPPDAPLSILPGADVHFCPDLARRVEEGEIATVNDRGRYLMVEFPFQGAPSRAEEVLFGLLAKGMIPIITHPERNLEFIRKPQRYYGMVRMGCLGQVTAMSLTGQFGPMVKKAAEKLLKSRLIHIIASDGHSSDGRPPLLSHGLKAASILIGKEEACRMVTEYPRSILQGERPHVPEPIWPKE